MSVVAITSSRTSPGATSLAVGLALGWSHQFERSLLIEADPAGGVLSLRFELAAAPSLTTFGSDIRNEFGADHVWLNTQDLRGVRCMPAPVDPRLASSWVERVTPDLVDNLRTLGAPTVIDLGWAAQDGPSVELAKAADTTLVVTRPDIAEVQSLLFQVRQLREAGAEVALVTIGSGPNDPHEIARLADVPLAAILPDDATVAAALGGAKISPTKFRRSLLWRTIAGLGEALLDEPTMTERAATKDERSDSALPAYPAPTYTPAAVEMPDAAAPAPVAEPAPAAAATPAIDDDRRVRVSVSGPSARTPENRMSEAIPDYPDFPVVEDNRRVRVSVPATPVLEPAGPVVETAQLVFGSGARQALDPAAPQIVGRHSSCAVVIKDSQVSRQHGRLSYSPDGWYYADLGSRNGTTLNGTPCTSSLLMPGDELCIGQSRVIFELPNGEVPALTARQLVSNRETECA